MESSKALRYWELSVVERARLSEEEFAIAEEVELMTAGVERVKAPNLTPEPEVPGPAKSVFRIEVNGCLVSEIAFSSAEDARKAVDLAFATGGEYMGGCSVKTTKPNATVRVVSDKIYERKAFDLAESEIRGWAKVREENEKALRSFHRAREKEDNALSSIREDIKNCRNDAAYAAVIRDTFVKYCGLTSDRETALRFLDATYTPEEVKSARNFFSDDFSVDQENAGK